MFGFFPHLLGILICDTTSLSCKLLNGPPFLATWPQSDCAPSLILGYGLDSSLIFTIKSLMADLVGELDSGLSNLYRIIWKDKHPKTQPPFTHFSLSFLVNNWLSFM